MVQFSAILNLKERHDAIWELQKDKLYVNYI